jgi:pimeloyl-ACP methyl ester carboxylesterase
MPHIDLPQGTLEYREQGRGPVVLFVHGLLVDAELWAPVIDELSTHCRCIAPTWPLGSHRRPMSPGADLSPAGLARLVADFMDALELDHVTLVGNDSGGAICQLVAADHGARLARLVLTDCDALEVFPPRRYAYLSWLPRVPGLAWLLARSMLHLPFVRRLPIAFGPLTRRPLPQALLRRWVEPLARDRGVRRDTLAFIRGVSPGVTLGAAERLTTFDRPVLFIWGANDPFFPVSLAERLAARLRDARVHTIADATTFVPLDQPAAVAAALHSTIIGTGVRAAS